MDKIYTKNDKGEIVEVKSVETVVDVPGMKNELNMLTIERQGILDATQVKITEIDIKIHEFQSTLTEIEKKFPETKGEIISAETVQP